MGKYTRTNTLLQQSICAGIDVGAYLLTDYYFDVIIILNKNKMILRPLKREDRSDFLETLSHLTDVGIYTDTLWNKLFDQLEKNNSHYCIVAEVGGRVVATATAILQQKFIHKGGTIGYVEDVVVHPDFRNRGIFKALMNELDSIFKQHGCYKSLLVCDHELVTMYKGVGYNRPKTDVIVRKDYVK